MSSTIVKLWKLESVGYVWFCSYIFAELNRGNLIHLRYINLSRARIEALPNSIIELQNLQTLKLEGCDRLGRLPSDLRKLVNLRSLDVRSTRLTQMPSGLGVLTSLHSLPLFMVNYKNSRASMWKRSTAQLRDLKNLNNLKDSLEIRIGEDLKLKDPIYEAEEANLSSKHALMELYIEWDECSHVEISDIKHDEAIIEGLKPHCNLKKLVIDNYKGEKFPSWAVEDNLCTTLPNLVEVRLDCLTRCQQLPSFSQLPFLKRLILCHLNDVEYMESSVPVIGSLSKEALFFPSLEELELQDMDKLKGWWREVEEVVGDDEASSLVGVTNLQHQSGNLQHLTNLRSILLVSLPLVELPEWIGCCSSLVRICIFECSKLTCLPEGLHKLTKLNQLRIIKCPGLTKRCQGPSGEDWPKISHIPFLNVSEDD